MYLKAWNEEKVMLKHIPDYVTVRQLRAYLWGAKHYGINWEFLDENDIRKLKGVKIE